MAQAAEFRFNPQVNWAGAGQQQARMGQGMDAFGQGITRFIQRKRQKKAETEELDGALTYMKQNHSELFPPDATDEEIKQSIKAMGGPAGIRAQLMGMAELGKAKAQTRQATALGEQAMATAIKTRTETEEYIRTQPQRDKAARQAARAEKARLKGLRQAQGLADRKQTLDETKEANEEANRLRDDELAYKEFLAGEQERARLAAIAAQESARQKEIEEEKRRQDNLRFVNEASDPSTRSGQFIKNNVGPDNLIRDDKTLFIFNNPANMRDAIMAQANNLAGAYVQPKKVSIKDLQKYNGLVVKKLDGTYERMGGGASNNQSPVTQTPTAQAKDEDDPVLNTYPPGTVVRLDNGKMIVIE